MGDASGNPRQQLEACIEIPAAIVLALVSIVNTLLESNSVFSKDEESFFIVEKRSGRFTVVCKCMKLSMFNRGIFRTNRVE